MNAEELPFNNDNFSNAHPTITRDGSELYFASNRPGGYGGMDLYMVRKEGPIWSEPINLGPNVNTEGNEMFPFISNIGTLYFASDGHAGLGGLDIFFSEKNQKGEWMIPLNMGVPLNGSQDDFSIYYDDTNDQGYFCSNRSGQGNDDIYFFQFKTLQEMTLNGNVTLEDSLVTMEGETILIESIGTGIVSETKLDSKGNFKYVAKPGEQIIVKLANKKYVDAPDTLFQYLVPQIIKDPNSNLGRKKLKLLAPINHVGPLKEYKEPDLTAIALLNPGNTKTEPNDVKKDDLGKTSGTETKKPVKVVKPEDKLPAKTPNEQKLSEFEKTVSVVNMDSLHIQNIYFDYNKSVLREEDKAILDKIVALLKNDPSMTVLVQAHCDSRGNRIYNENLSMSRAFTVKAYLIGKGIPRNRMKINWYGESRQVNNCVDENAPCSEEEYKANRRAEFKIIKPIN
jgi:outer membrane protein OmpA-like peptidoglycan-associated protein